MAAGEPHRLSTIEYVVTTLFTVQEHRQSSYKRMGLQKERKTK